MSVVKDIFVAVFLIYGGIESCHMHAFCDSNDKEQSALWSMWFFLF